MAFISRFPQTAIYCWAFIWRDPQIMAIKPSGDGQGITLMKLDKVEWWSTQPRLWRCTFPHRHAAHSMKHYSMPFSFFFSFLFKLLRPSWPLFSFFPVPPSSFLHFSNQSPVRCSTRGLVSSSGKVSLFVLNTVGSRSIHQPCHQRCQNTHRHTCPHLPL